MEWLLACGPAPGIDGILWVPHPVWVLLLALKRALIVGLIPMGLLLSLPSCVCIGLGVPFWSYGWHWQLFPYSPQRPC